MPVKYIITITILLFLCLAPLTSFGGNDSFEIISKKNLFRPDRSEWIIETKDNKPVEKKVNPDKLDLYGTIIVGDKKSALIYNKKAKVKGRRNKREQRTELYELGDYLGGYVISSIDEKRVVLDYYGEKETLYLHAAKEPSQEDLPLPKQKKVKPRANVKQTPKKQKTKSNRKSRERKRQKLASSKIPEALAKSPLMSQEKMKKVLEFNKEIMEEMKKK